MPNDTEIEMMITDPKKWLNDYKVGNPYRSAGANDHGSNFGLNAASAYATQVWLMGDGVSDAYSLLRNQVYASDQNYSALSMISMVSNDIQNVNINGLS